MTYPMPHVLELWLVRHGESTFNAEGRFAGWSDPPLTPAGEAMARALLPRLADIPFDGIWRSDRIRAKETARLAGFSRVPADARLREIHFGDLEGKTFLETGEEWRARLRSFADFAAPGGESTVDVQRRAEAFLAGFALTSRASSRVCGLGFPPPKAPAIIAEDPFPPPASGGSPGILQKLSSASLTCIRLCADAAKCFRGSRASVRFTRHPNSQTGASGRSLQCRVPGT